MTHGPTAGTRIGPYIVKSRLAVGGMAEVFLAAEQRSAGAPRDVVIKRMLPQLSHDTLARRLFEDEGKLGASVDHPNVARLIDVGRDGDAPFLVLEYVRGCDLWRLDRHLAQTGRVLGAQLALHVATELLTGLAAVHEARDASGEPLGIVHQDVSPSNILLSVFGEVKLSDLGIARTRLRDHFGATPTGDRMKGKLGYFAPEQVHGRNVGQSSDVFSAAAVIAELFLGEPLFRGPSELATLLAIRDVDLSRLLRKAQSLPDGLAAVLAQALTRDPAERMQSARELLDALAPYRSADTAPVRREFGDLVAVAASATGDLSIEATPTRQTMPGLDPGYGGEEHERPTLESLHDVYHVEDSGRPDGSYTYAQIVERIATDSVRPEAVVRVSGSPPRPLSSIDELARHVPPSRGETAAREPQVAFVDGGFVRALLASIVDRASGLWVCERMGERKEFALVDGIPSFIASNLAGEMLGEFLVARGVINRGELDMALAVLPRYDGRLGDTLVALGLVEPVQLFRQIQVQVRERMLDLFVWTEGSARFLTGVKPREAPFPPEADVPALVDEGMKRRIALGIDRTLLDRPRRGRVQKAPRAEAVLTSPLVTRLERLLLQRAKNGPNVDDLLDDTARDVGDERPRVERALLVLVHAGALEFTA